MTAARSPWLVCRRRQPAARLRLYCFPHTGGSPGEYVRWADELPELEVWGIQPPGRGARIAETPLASIEAFTAGLLSETGFAAPFMFFGHSLGALTAFETVRALRAEGAPLPRRLILSAYPAPHLEHPRSPVHALGDTELMTEVGRRYGLPETLTGDPELLRLVVPAYRACASSTGYQHQFDNRYLWMKLKRIIGSHGATLQEQWEANRLIAAGAVVPALSAVYPLARVGEAARTVQANSHTGKVGVLCLAPQPGLGVTDPAARRRVGEDRLRIFR